MSVQCTCALVKQPGVPGGGGGGAHLVAAAGISEGDQDVWVVQLTADQRLQSWGHLRGQGGVRDLHCTPHTCLGGSLHPTGLSGGVSVAPHELSFGVLLLHPTWLMLVVLSAPLQ